MINGWVVLYTDVQNLAKEQASVMEFQTEIASREGSVIWYNKQDCTLGKLKV